MSSSAESGGLRPVHYLAYLSLCLIWGTTWMAIRVLVQQVPPLWAAALRALVAAGVLLVVVLAQRRRMPQGREWRALVVLGVTLMGVPYGCLFWAEQYVTAAMTAVIFSSLPIAVALITPIMSHHRVPGRAVVALLVAVAAIGALFWGNLAGSHEAVLGGMAVLAAVVVTAWSIHYAKRETMGVDPFASTAVQMLVGAGVLMLATAALERGRPAQWSGSAVAAFLFLSIFGSAVAFAVYFWLLRRMLPYQISSTALIVPVVAMVEGGLILGEPITAVMVGAAAVVIVAVGMVLRMQS